MVKKFNDFITESNEDNSENNKWILYYGLGGGFGGARNSKAFVGSKEDAEMEAWRSACEEYESYDGLHGLRSVSDIMEEDGIEDEEEAEEIYNEEKEGWLEYWVVPYNDEEIKKARYNTHFEDL
jgi:hypothetical protein